MTPTTDQFRREAEEASAALPGLLLAAERLSAALSIGAHGQRRAGTGEEFWQYRPVTSGDSARNIDWRRSARSDLQFVRDREVQTAQSALFWVSHSAGMAYAGGPDRPQKGARARLLALSLAIALLRGGEKVALLGETPRTGRQRIEEIARGLLAPLETSLPAEDLPDPQFLRPGQRVVLISDFLGDPEPVLGFLSRAAASGVRGVLLQVLDPDEESFPFAGAVLFRMPGSGLRHDTRDAAGLRNAYLARLAERRALLTRAAQDSGWQFGSHDTASPAASALLWLAAMLEG